MNPDVPDFDGLWDYDNPAESEQRLRALLPAAEQGGDSAYRAELLTQVARTQGLQRQFEDAHSTLDHAESLLDGSPSRAMIRLVLERGRVFNSSGDPGRAQPLFQRAWQMALAEREDFYAVDAAHMMVSPRWPTSG